PAAADRPATAPDRFEACEWARFAKFAARRGSASSYKTMPGRRLRPGLRFASFACALRTRLALGPARSAPLAEPGRASVMAFPSTALSRKSRTSPTAYDYPAAAAGWVPGIQIPEVWEVCG